MKNTARFVKKMLTSSVMAATLLSAIPAQADNPPPTFKADAPNRYVVKKGDRFGQPIHRLKTPILSILGIF